MDIQIPISAVLVVLALTILALVFVGYQLDDIYRRMKEFGPQEVSREDLFNFRESVVKMINQTNFDSFQEDMKWKDRVAAIEEQLKPKPKGKRGRPRKKVIDGHIH